MKRLSSIIAAALVTTAFAAPAFATSPDVYVVNFRNAQDNNSVRLDSELSSALVISGVNAEEVIIDTSTAAKWEKAHMKRLIATSCLSSTSGLDFQGLLLLLTLSQSASSDA